MSTLVSSRICQALVFSFASTFAIIGWTIFCPFFTIDDSDVLRRATDYLAQHGWMAYLKAYVPEDLVQRRYWPGYAVYILFRTHLMGLSSIGWHTMNVLLYVAIGTMLSWLSFKACKSYWPGLIAYIITLTAGVFDYQTTWFSYVFVNSFEPYMALVWLIGAVVYVGMLQATGRSCWWLAAAVVVVLGYSVTIKENAFLVVGSAAVLMLVHSFLPGGNRAAIRCTGGALLLMAGGWGALVYSLTPRDAGYAGTSSLVTSAVELFKNFARYARLIYQASGPFVLIGLLLGVLRISLTRRHYRVYLFTTVLCLAQIGSLCIWPTISLRLIYPAFLGLLFVASMEFYQMWKLAESAHGRKPLFVFGGAVALLMMVASLAHSNVAHILMLTAIVLLAGTVLIHASNMRALCTARGAFAGCVLFLGLGLVVTGVSHVTSYPAIYKSTELTRHLVVRKASEHCPPQARLIWFINPGQEIFPYSSDIHARLFFDRDDLESIPASHFLEQGATLRQGDMIVMYGDYYKHKPEGDFQHFQITQGSYISPILNHGDFLTALRDNFWSNRDQSVSTKLLRRYYEGTINAYLLREAQWEIPVDWR